MATKTLVLGESGTGKSTSLRNFDPNEVCYINPAKKPLPFKGKFESLTGTTDFREISKFIKASKKKVIIIDDAQYIMAFQYMYRLRESGWDKYNDIQADFFSLIDLVDSLGDDVTVYFMSHIETVDGRQKMKTIGKMLDEKITMEGMFTTVLKTLVSDGKYFFVTQNGGNDTVKSPMNMFPTFAIDNDLKYVDEKIRNYYEIGEFKSDEEMKEEDQKVKNEDLEKAANGRVKRNRSNSKDETPVNEDPPKENKRSRKNDPPAENNDEPPKENRRSRKKADEESSDLVGADGNIKVEQGDPIPFDQAEEVNVEKPNRRSRKKADDAAAETNNNDSAPTENKRSRRSRKDNEA